MTKSLKSKLLDESVKNVAVRKEAKLEHKRRVNTMIFVVPCWLFIRYISSYNEIKRIA